MRYRMITDEPPTLEYRNGAIHFCTMMLHDGYWHWLAIKGQPPRRSNDKISGTYVRLASAKGLFALYDLKKAGFHVTDEAALRVMQRLVREGVAEEI